MSTEATAATEAAMNLDSIKELMDHFDPASLLPDLGTVIGKVELVCRIAVIAGPLVLLVMGLIYLFLTPKEANHYIGYRCYYGMGSVQAWRFTQRVAGLLFAGLGLILTVIMLIVSGGFSGMEAMDMVWRAVTCLIWQGVLALLATLGVNICAMVFFTAKGEPRRRTGRSRRAGA